VSATTVKLLQVASEIVGGDEALAKRLGISERLLSRFGADRLELPDHLLLRAVDIVIAERQSRLPSTGSEEVRT
jgi:DNA-binding transcriptional regulator YdaS (Cro superfamily)